MGFVLPVLRSLGRTKQELLFILYQVSPWFLSVDAEPCARDCPSGTHGPRVMRFQGRCRRIRSQLNTGWTVRAREQGCLLGHLDRGGGAGTRCKVNIGGPAGGLRGLVASALSLVTPDSYPGPSFPETLLWRPSFTLGWLHTFPLCFSPPPGLAA